MADEALRFGLLGALEVRAGDQLLPVTGTRQRALLVSLLLHANQPVSAERLVDNLWSGNAPPGALSTIQSYISQLRRIVEPERARPSIIVTRPIGYEVVVGADCLDTARFEAAVRRAREARAAGRVADALHQFDAALRLWRGDPLADVAYADFAQPEIVRLTELRAICEEDRADSLLESGRPDLAVVDLEHLVARLPLRERARGLLMVALYRTGRQADALRCYQEGRHVLVEQLGLEPGPELQAIEQRIVQGDPSLLPGDGAAGSGGLAAPVAPWRDEIPVPIPAVDIVGRASEREALQRALDEAIAGSGQVVLLHGEAGIGKTTLLDDLGARAAAAGCVVVTGRCDTAMSSLAFWPWIEALRELTDAVGIDAVGEAAEPARGQLATLLPELGAAPVTPTDAEADAFRVFDAISRVLRRVSEGNVVVVLLDDLHWSDVTSAQLLSFVARRLSRSRVLIVAAYRDHDIEASSPLGAAMTMLSRAIRIRLPLGPLATDAIAEIVQRATGAAPDASALAGFVERTSGNPLFVTELARDMTGAEGTSGAPLPTSVRDVVLQRVSMLPADVVETLRFATFAPLDFRIDFAAEFLRVDEARILDHLEIARRAGLVREDPHEIGSWQFTHPLVRDALLSEMSLVRRAEMHARLGDFGAALLDRGLPRRFVDRVMAGVADHYAEAAGAGRASEAIDWARRAAARATARYGYASAAAILQRALDVAGTYRGFDEQLLIDLRIELGMAHRDAGALDTARGVLLQAAESARGLDDSHRTAQALLATGGGSLWGWWHVYGENDDELVALLAHALDRVTEPALRARLMARLAVESVFSRPRDELDALTRDALAIARKLEHPATLALALAARHVVIWRPETHGERLAIASDLASIDHPLAATERLAGQHFLVMDHLEVGDRAAADLAFERFEAMAQQSGRPSALVQVLWTKVMRCTLDGDLDKAEGFANEAMAVGENLENTLTTMVFGGTMAYIRLLQGRLVELHELIEYAVETMPSVRDGFSAALLCSLVEQGRDDEARSLFAVIARDDYAMVRRVLLEPIVLAMLAEMAPLTTVDPDDASGLLRLLKPYAGTAIVFAPGMFCRGAADAHIGMTKLALGDAQGAIESLTTALSMNERLGSGPARAWNAYWLAVALQRAGRGGDDVRALLDEASADAARFDMADLARRVKAAYPA